MAQATKNYKRTVRGSVGAGISSVVGGSGRTYYILEHKNSSKYHSAGESQEIIVDQIELGRDPKCQVRYDDSFGTVSRRHAAISRSGDGWILIPLSETNSTLLNGNRVDRETRLNNGDEIQLSAEGPRLGFIVPTGNKAFVGSIGLTRRLTLFRQQALAPYKTALTILSILLVLVIAGGIYWGMQQQEKLDQTTQELAQTAQNLEVTKSELEQAIAEGKGSKEEIEKQKKQLASVNAQIASVRKEQQEAIKAAEAKAKSSSQSIPATSGTPSAGTATDLTSCNKHVYAIYCDEFTYTPEGGQPETISSKGSVGTGFMLEDGRFVTARHVIEPWYYLEISNANKLNKIAFNGGSIHAKYTAISPAGKIFTFLNTQIVCDRGNDKTAKTDDNFIEVSATRQTDDWAYFRAPNVNGGLKYDNALSRTLQQGQVLHLLGYPAGLGTEDPNNLFPQYSTSIKSSAGLDANGLMLSSNNDTFSGSSGCPVLIEKDGEFVVVGIHTGSWAERKGVTVPISAVK